MSPDAALRLANRWVPVESSWLAAMLWVPDAGRATGTLSYRTKKGDTLVYGNCTAAFFAAALSAKSKGTFLNRAVKPRLPYLG